MYSLENSYVFVHFVFLIRQKGPIYNDEFNNIITLGTTLHSVSVSWTEDQQLQLMIFFFEWRLSTLKVKSCKS